jgi:hypothetical protein
MVVTGKSSASIETLVNEFGHGELWESYVTHNEQFFSDATERYLAQKFKTPDRSNDLEIHNLSMTVQISDPNGYTEGVWAEIREIGASDSIGSLVTNGTSDKTHSDIPPDWGSNRSYLNTFFWTDKPQLNPDTEYWIVLRSDWTDVGDFWRTTWCGDSTLRWKGIREGIYQLDSSDNKTTIDGGNKNAPHILINGIETTVPIPPPQDFVLRWGILEATSRDTILSWPFTTGIGNRDWDLLWDIFKQVSNDWRLIWNIILSQDTTLLWTIIEPTVVDTIIKYSINQKIDEDTILRWKLLLSADTVLPWSINFPLEQDFILRWPFTTRIDDADWILLWKLVLSRDTVLHWNMLHYFSLDWAVKWGIKVATDTVIPIPLMGYVDSIKKLLWNIEDRVWQDYVIKYNLPISREWVIRYSLNDAISRVFKIVNDIENQVRRDWGIRYSIKVESDCILLIPLQGEVSRDFVLRHDITGEVGDAVTIKYDLLNYNPVEKDTILRNTLLGKPRFYKITFS